MKRRICAMAAVLALILSMSVSAAAPRAVTPTPYLTFSGTTATCKVSVWGDYSTDRVSVTVELRHGGDLLTSWTQSGSGQVLFSKTYSKGIEKGEAYTMVVNYTVAGKSYGPLETSATCRG